jgi:hypothetical protein
VRWVEDAERPQTREHRVAKTLAGLLAGRRTRRSVGPQPELPVTVNVRSSLAVEESPAYSSMVPGSTTNLPRLS